MPGTDFEGMKETRLSGHGQQLKPNTTLQNLISGEDWVEERADSDTRVPLRHCRWQGNWCQGKWLGGDVLAGAWEKLYVLFFARRSETVTALETINMSETQKQTKHKFICFYFNLIVSVFWFFSFEVRAIWLVYEFIEIDPQIRLDFWNTIWTFKGLVFLMTCCTLCYQNYYEILRTNQKGKIMVYWLCKNLKRSRKSCLVSIVK